MAEQVAVPAGVNPNNAIPMDATVIQRSTTPNIPPVVGSNEEKPGFVAPTPAAPAAADDKDYAAFLAWKAAQEGGKPVVKEEPAPVAKPVVTEGIGAEQSLEMVKAAAASDPYLTSTFNLFSLVAPKVDLARAVGTALDRGDVSLIDVAYIREAAGDNADKLIETAKGLVTHVTNTVESITTNIYEQAGGQEQFDAATAVFNEVAPKFIRGFVAEGVNSGNPERIKEAISYMLDFVKQSGKLPQAPEGHVRANGGSPSAAMGLSKAQYQAERLKLNRQDRNYADHERELTARRQLGKSLGM